MKKYFCFLAIIALTGCGDIYDDRMSLKNSSEAPLYISISRDDALAHAEEITYRGPGKKDYFTRKVLRDTTQILNRQGSSDVWPKFVGSGNEGKLRIFIINHKNFEKYTWEEICNKHLYKKAKMSVADLDKINWLIDMDSIDKLPQ